MDLKVRNNLLNNISNWISEHGKTISVELFSKETLIESKIISWMNNLYLITSSNLSVINIKKLHTQYLNLYLSSNIKTIDCCSI